MVDPKAPGLDVSGKSTSSVASSPNEVRSVSSDAGVGRDSVSASPDALIDILNELVETSKDGEKGFALAAKDAKDARLTSVFSQGEQSCRAAAQELQAQVLTLGGKPDAGGTLKGAVHRGWVSVKEAVSPRDDLALLEECERGEDYAKAQYSKALKQYLTPELRQLLERQYRGVVENHDRVRDLRNEFRKS